jgi:hypothetical protein
MIFILTKKYNVVIDDKNPDIIFYTNYQQNPSEYDTFLKCVPKLHDRNDKTKKFVYLSGEHADFQSPILSGENQWGMGYQKFNHPRYIRMPSYVIDAWTMFDESRVVDTPFDWMLKQSRYEDVKHQFTRFCSVTQASSNSIREKLFDILSTYKPVTSSGPWRQNLFGPDALNKYQWMHPEMNGRCDGLTYREKMMFFKTCKFNMCIAFGEADYRIEEKLGHAFFANTIPLFHGNRFIEEDGINPQKIINLHKYTNLSDCLELIKQIDVDESLHKRYIEEPIFVNNVLPIYFNTEYLLEFLSSVVEA